MCAYMIVCVVTEWDHGSQTSSSIAFQVMKEDSQFDQRQRAKCLTFKYFKPLSSIFSKLLKALFFKATERSGLIVSNA